MVLVAKKKKEPTAHEKRRHGKHHAPSRRYHNTYWPYLPLVLIVTLGVAINSLWPTLQSAVLGYATNTSVNGLLIETNKQRVAHNVGQLVLNAQLNAAAQAKADDMAARDYWSHNTPEGNPPWVFVAQAGYRYEAAGENLAYGFDSSGATVAGWMGSPSHRANMLNGGFQHAGFGIANAENYQGNGPQTIVVAMYGTPVQAAPAPPPATAPAQSQPTPPAPPPTQAEPTPVPVPEPVATAEEQPVATSAPRSFVAEEPAPSGTQQVARVQLLTTENAAWTVFVATMIAAVAAAVFIIRHSIFWHRVLIKGERFAARHHFLDIVLVTLAVTAALLTRTAGTIH